MERIRVSLSQLPAWLFSVITLIVILWLTLAPKPLGENPPALFPGADKLVHGIMFGFFGNMMMLDWQRKHQWVAERSSRIIWLATLSAFSGIMIEIAQGTMDLGRGFEYGDICADVVGAYCFAIFYLIFQKFWIYP